MILCAALQDAERIGQNDTQNAGFQRPLQEWLAETVAGRLHVDEDER